MFQRSIPLVFALLAVTILTACGGGSSASPPAGGLTLVPTDGQIMVSWNDDQSVQYDMWYAPATDPTACQSTSGGIPQGCEVVSNVRSPYAATGLINGVNYSFVMNARKNGGKAGSNTPVVSAIPSLSGTVWHVGTSLGSNDLHGVTFGGFTSYTVNAVGAPIGYYLAVGNSGSMYKSVDGVNWNLVAAQTANDLNAAIFSQSYFIAAGAAGTVLYSLDSVNWTTVTPSTSQSLNALADNSGLQKCYGTLVGAVNPTVDYFSYPSGCGFWGSKANNATIIVAVGDSGTILNSSNGGITWTTAVSSGITTTQPLHGVAYFPTSATWFAVGAGGTLISSTNGTNWNLVSSGTYPDLTSIAVLATTNPGLTTTYTLVAVGAGGTILTSSDGVTWNSQTVSPAVHFNAVTGWSQFVAVGDSGALFTSIDGTIWTPVASGTSATLFSILGAAGQYNALGQAGASIYSQ